MRHLKRGISLMTVLLASCVPTEGKDHQDMMDAIEANLRLPRRAASFDKYARYYAKAPDGTIVGLIMIPLEAGNPKAWDNLSAGQRRWVSDYRPVISVFDGVCSVMHITYDPQSRKREGPFCQGAPSD